MPRNGSDGTNRRELLRGLGSAAVAGSLLAGSAAAGPSADSHCHYEYWCLRDTLLRKHCCEDPETGEEECTNWQQVGSC